MAERKYSQEQKDRFFDLVDRGGSVRAAAVAAGVSQDAAYRWMRQAGLSMQRATPRQYSKEQKDEFFRLIAADPNVAAAARALGITRVTCYAWAYKAGIRTSEARKVNARREEFLRLRTEGLSRTQARERVGVDGRSAVDWDKGITIINRGRVYPDGRVVLYAERDTGRVPERRTRAIGGSVDLNVVERVIDPRYLSVLEREQLADLHRSGLSIRQIAAQMQRSPSTISRELRRNTVSSRGYLPHTAHRLSVQRRTRPREAKLVANEQLRAYVQAKLKCKWSPQQISSRLAKEFPTVPEMRVSTETIYQAVYVHARGQLKRELGSQLRRGRTARRPQQQPDARRPRFVEPMTAISERPAEADSREVPGHWEGDLIVGSQGRSAIATLVERQTRFTMLIALPSRSTDDVVPALAQHVQQLPEQLRRSLTWDRGTEMAKHAQFTVDTGVQVYFCDPRSPWQRGSNENTNGLLRQYFPKGKSVADYTQDELDAVARKLNTRPRETLGWLTPSQALANAMR